MRFILFIDNSEAVKAFVENRSGISSDIIDFFNTTSNPNFKITNPESVPGL